MHDSLAEVILPHKNHANLIIMAIMVPTRTARRLNDGTTYPSPSSYPTDLSSDAVHARLFTIRKADQPCGFLFVIGASCQGLKPTRS